MTVGKVERGPDLGCKSKWQSCSSECFYFLRVLGNMSLVESDTGKWGEMFEEKASVKRSSRRLGKWGLIAQKPQEIDKQEFSMRQGVACWSLKGLYRRAFNDRPWHLR